MTTAGPASRSDGFWCGHSGDQTLIKFEEPVKVNAVGVVPDRCLDAGFGTELAALAQVFRAIP